LAAVAATGHAADAACACVGCVTGIRISFAYSTCCTKQSTGQTTLHSSL
jgi:hypothetical protein